MKESLKQDSKLRWAPCEEPAEVAVVFRRPSRRCTELKHKIKTVVGSPLLRLASGSSFDKIKFAPAIMSSFDQAPDDEADVDREIRIQKMKRELEQLSGGSMISGGFGDVPPNLEEIFLARVCEFEKAPYDTNF